MIQVVNRALETLELIAKDPDKTKSLSDIANALEDPNTEGDLKCFQQV